MQTSRCFRAVIGEMCVGSMVSFTAIWTMTPPLPVTLGLLILGIGGGALHGSSNDSCKEA